MRLKIRCDEESTVLLQKILEPNWAVVTDEEETHLYSALALASPAASGPQPPSVPTSSLTKPRAASCIFASVGSESASSPRSGF
jgi:hypothetical protein